MTRERQVTILYIEDNQANQLLVRMILERRPDLRLVTADDGAAGLQAALNEHPDLILLDISLPDMNGYAVLEALRREERTRELPVVAISGDLPAKPSGDRRGFSRYLKKPIEITPLFKAVDELLPRT